MNARAEVIQAYGGRCAWCACDDLTQLEIDHLDGGQGQGNAHRRDMAARGTTIAYELRALGYPPGYRLLCGCCHDIRTYGKVVRMPPRRGHKDLHVSLPDAVIDEIDRLAKQRPDGSKSHVILDLLAGHGAGQSTALIAKLHERLDGIETTVTTLSTRVDTLVRLVGDLPTMARHMGTLQGDITAIYDTVKRLDEQSKKGWFGR